MIMHVKDFSEQPRIDIVVETREEILSPLGAQKTPLPPPSHFSCVHMQSHLVPVLQTRVWRDLRTTHLLLGEMNVQRQSNHQRPEALVLERRKYSEPINHLIDHTTGEW